MFQCQVSADNSLDNLQGSNSIFRSVWLDKKCVSIGLAQIDQILQKDEVRQIVAAEPAQTRDFADIHLEIPEKKARGKR
jgi:hypothetical protein